MPPPPLFAEDSPQHYLQVNYVHSVYRVTTITYPFNPNSLNNWYRGVMAIRREGVAVSPSPSSRAPLLRCCVNLRFSWEINHQTQLPRGD